MAIYYVDNTRPDDTGDGLSEATAWKTISKAETESASMVAGDSLLFKRGQTFEGDFEYGGASGTLGNEVTISSYGTGARPIITAIGEQTGAWVDQGSNKWAMTRSVKTTRLWKGGVEQKSTSPVKYGETWNEFGLIAGCVWIWDSSTLYFYSTTDPSTETFTGAVRYTVFTFTGVSHIKITELDLRGGSSHCLNLVNSSFIEVSYNDIGKEAGYGVVIDNCSDLTIKRNTFDNDFKLLFDGVTSYDGTDARGSNDGIVSWGGVTNSNIMYNSFINWGHACIAFTATLVGDETSGNKIYNNHLTAPDLHYSRAFGYSGTYMTLNEFYNNYVDTSYIRSQMNGVSNHVHHNYFKNHFNTPYKIGEQGS